MRIEELKKETTGGRARVSAKIRWEVADRNDFELFFETTEMFADDLTLDPNAFLLAAILPAMANGETRVWVDGNLCPELKDNLMLATGWVRRWYGPPRNPVTLECSQGFVHQSANKSPRAASFLSGGVDSMQVLRSNRLTFSSDHPRWIKDCIVIHGMDMGNRANGGKEYPIFDRTMKLLSNVARETNVRLIPVYTNARHLDDTSQRFNLEYHGAVLAATAHVFSGKLSSVAIAATTTFDDFMPWGSHLLLDPNYSSTGLQVLHAGAQYSRLEKVKIVAQWPIGLQNLRVCIRNPVHQINCGECHKCIRTMLELYAAGKLGQAVTFPDDEIHIERIRKLRPGVFRFLPHYFLELLPDLQKLGRNDIVGMIKKRHRQYLIFYSWAERLRLVQWLKHCDGKYLHSKISDALMHYL